MNSVIQARVDLMFRAFSDQTRLRILCLLMAGEACVGDLVSILEVDQPSVSRHLAYLRRARLVVVRKAKMWSYYSLAPVQGEFHQKLLDCLACCFVEVPQIQCDQARAAKLKGTGCCPETAQATPIQPLPSKACCSPDN